FIKDELCLARFSSYYIFSTFTCHASLDTISITGFSHDFGALDGKYASVTNVFDVFNSSSSVFTLNVNLHLLVQVFPFLIDIPTSCSRLVSKLNTTMEEISNVLLAQPRRELNVGTNSEKEEKSITGLLSTFLFRSMIQAIDMFKTTLLQMKDLLLAEYETMSSEFLSYTQGKWALIELSQNPDIQMKLQNELVEHSSDPMYDQLSNSLLYLDAVIHEILHMHTPVCES
ncbi:cytochrome P450, partial [Butyriboletus roseoflavus]